MDISTIERLDEELRKADFKNNEVGYRTILKMNQNTMDLINFAGAKDIMGGPACGHHLSSFIFDYKFYPIKIDITLRDEEIQIKINEQWHTL
jgi:hypothetical protein